MEKGLYRPEFEKDNCGFGLIAQMDGVPSHWLVRTAIDALACLTHRGAVAADGKSGDGCGLLLRKPDGFFRGVTAKQGITLAPLYAVGMIFLNQDAAKATLARQQLERELSAVKIQRIARRYALRWARRLSSLEQLLRTSDKMLTRCLKSARKDERRKRLRTLQRLRAVEAGWPDAYGIRSSSSTYYHFSWKPLQTTWWFMLRVSLACQITAQRNVPPGRQ